MCMHVGSYLSAASASIESLLSPLPLMICSFVINYPSSHPKQKKQQLLPPPVRLLPFAAFCPMGSIDGAFSPVNYQNGNAVQATETIL